MAPNTEKSTTPIVSNYVERFESLMEDRKRAAETALRAQKEREAEARTAAVRNESPLATLQQIPTTSEHEEDVSISNTPPPRHRQRSVPELDGQPVPTHPSQQSGYTHPEPPLTPMQSYVTSSSDSEPEAEQSDLHINNARIRELEARLGSQQRLVRELEQERQELTRQEVDLRARIDEADQLLLQANRAGANTAAQHERRVASLVRQIERLMEDRRQRDREIEARRTRERELQRELDDEREKVRRFEQRGEFGGAVGASGGREGARRRPSEENGKRRHSRRHGSGSSIKIKFELGCGEKKKKKKSSSRNK